ncbi:MAG: septum formation initiator family protein [Lachnospiraceae bacterium]|jgi:cell division protein DivIC|nr:septum formation initiator family protein [Lachnospiraceae bacterium]
MGRRANRKKNHTTRIVTLVLLLLVVVLGFNVIKLYRANEDCKVEKQNLEEQYEAQTGRQDELSALEKFTKTMEYVEQVAREKLGMVFKNEIIFKSDE